uniref:2-oxoglutarate and iron-dependent oxygenase domain containing 2 n=1 Tax=Astyanax mexicanus TaxID=7994 RepID=A0A8B9JE47_ASTMX
VWAVCQILLENEIRISIKVVISSLQESYLIPEFLQIVKYCQSDGATQEGLMKLIDSEAAPRVYRFPIFTKNFCRDLIEELEHFEESDAPKGRPNTMNNYGVEIHIYCMIFLTVHFLIIQIMKVQQAQQTYSPKLQVKKQLIKFRFEDYTELGIYFDTDYITYLKKNHIITISQSYFKCNSFVPLSETECAEVEHRVTEAVLHRGQQMHGALPISSGLRWNLIIWMRASRHRNRLCPMCGRTPRLQPSRGHGDGFTAGAGGADGWSCALT